MSIILNLEKKVVEDIIAVIKRLPFQPHFLVHLEEQLEAQLESLNAPAVDPVIPAAPAVADPVAAAEVVNAPAAEAPVADAAPADSSAV